jgi:uncharacterized membrane protein
MKTIKIIEKLDLPVEKLWELFTDLDNYPKYFKYVKTIYKLEEMSLNSEWYDFATFIVPIVVKHKTTVFEKNKQLGFDVNLPFGGFVRERITFNENKGSTTVEGILEYDFANPIFKGYEDKFEKRMRESIDGAVLKFKKELDASKI